MADAEHLTEMLHRIETGFSDQERALAEGAKLAHYEPAITVVRTATTLYAVKGLRESLDALTQSNEAISASATKYSRWLAAFTAALVLVGIVQIAVTVIQG